MHFLIFISIPHARGDGPFWRYLPQLTDRIPHARGDGPANLATLNGYRSIPHARGDGPEDNIERYTKEIMSPHRFLNFIIDVPTYLELDMVLSELAHTFKKKEILSHGFSFIAFSKKNGIEETGMITFHDERTGIDENSLIDFYSMGNHMLGVSINELNIVSKDQQYIQNEIKNFFLEIFDHLINTQIRQPPYGVINRPKEFEYQTTNKNTFHAPGDIDQITSRLLLFLDDPEHFDYPITRITHMKEEAEFPRYLLTASLYSGRNKKDDECMFGSISIAYRCFTIDCFIPQFDWAAGFCDSLSRFLRGNMKKTSRGPSQLILRRYFVFKNYERDHPGCTQKEIAYRTKHKLKGKITEDTVSNTYRLVEGKML